MLKVVHNDIKYLLRCTGNMASFGGTRFGGGDTIDFEITDEVKAEMLEMIKNSEHPKRVIFYANFSIGNYKLRLTFTKNEYSSVPKISQISSIRIDEPEITGGGGHGAGMYSANLTFEIPYISGGLKNIIIYGIERVPDTRHGHTDTFNFEFTGFRLNGKEYTGTNDGYNVIRNIKPVN
jgi:hypothetical protein